jgi:hypothetical protein
VPGLLVDLPLAHFDAARAELAPGAGIGLVVLVGDDDGVAGLHPAFERMAQRVGIGGRRGAEMHPVDGDIECLRHALVGEVDGLSGFARGRVEAIGLDIGGPEILLHAVENGRAGVGAAGILEERHVLEIGLPEGGELSADAREVEGQRIRHYGQTTGR